MRLGIAAVRGIGMYKDIFDFQDQNKTEEERIKAFADMSQEEFDKLLATCGTTQGKVYYKQLFAESKKQKGIL